MDITIDNSKSSEIDNVTQTLISNANNDPKLEASETSNNLFNVTGEQHQLNDRLNNIMDMNNSNNPFGDFGKEHNLNVIETKDNHGAFVSNIDRACLENDGDMGPETSVDTTDDADIDTDLLECSTLSHSKETLPSSDNPFDNKFSHQSFDPDEMNVHDKPTAPMSPISADSPFEVHSTEDVPEQNVHFDSMVHFEYENQKDNSTEKRGELGPGEDNFKTDTTVLVAEETVTEISKNVSEQITDIDQIESFESEVPGLQMPTDTGFCGDSEMLESKGDMAYNQFAEFIEQPYGKMESLMQELGQADFLEANKPLQPAENTATTPSPTPLSPVGKSNEQQEFLSEVMQEASSIVDEVREEVSSEHEKYIDEMVELEKSMNLLSEDCKHMMDETSIHHVNTQYNDSETNYTSEEIASIKKQVATDNFETSMQDRYSEQKLDYDCGKDWDDVSEKMDTIQEQETENIDADDIIHEKPFDPKEVFDSEVQELNDFETNGDITDLSSVEKGIKDETIVTKEVHFEQFAVSPNPPEVAYDESHTNEIVEESVQQQHLYESQSEPLTMEMTSVEKPFTTNDDDQKLFDAELELKNEEETIQEKLPSLEHIESHIEPDVLKEEIGIETQDSIIRTEETSDIAIPQESCVESLDESNNTKTNVEEKSETLTTTSDLSLENIDDTTTKPEKTTTPQIESQETEELNKKQEEAEEEKEHLKQDNISESLDKEVEDMTSQLNPEAKEFIPGTSPVLFDSKLSPILARSLNGEDVIAQSPQRDEFTLEGLIVPPQSDFDLEIANCAADVDEPKNLTAAPILRTPAIPCINGDDLVVAQSPQKGVMFSMNDITLPTPSEFVAEIANRPAELYNVDVPQSLNLKESMHEPEKEQISPGDNYDSSLNETSEMRSPIDESFGKIEDMMNTVQMLPDDDEIECDATKLNGALTSESNTNGDIPLVSDIAKLKLEEPIAAVIQEKAAIKGKTEKIVKSPETKKTDLKSKTSSTGPKKATSATSATLSDTSKAKTTTTAATASKTKVGTSLTARPRTAPAPSSKPASTEKKSSTNVISARAKPDTKSSTIGLKKLPLTKTKPDESKPAVRQVVSKVASTARTATTSRPTSSTNTATTAATKRVGLSSSSSAAPPTTKTTGPRPALSPSSKPSTITSTHKPAISPRSTVTSTLRKTEALKSPTAPAKPTTAKSTTTVTKTTTSRTSGGVSSTRTTTSTTTTAKRTSGSGSGAMKSTTSSATTATKKPLPIKKPAGSTTAVAIVKKSADKTASPPAAQTAETEAIRMNGTASVPPAVTTNGESKD